MGSGEILSSPFAFYAFYQLFSRLDTSNSKKDATGNVTFDQIAYELFPGTQTDAASEKTSLFITWKKKSKGSSEFQLRGCIGTFAKLPLLRGIEKYALIAAFEDHRFPPISAAEVKDLQCSCNVLHEFQSIYAAGKGDIYDWELGVHGIELKFRDPHSSRLLSATFLPEVMPEQDWDKRETFVNLIEKAGCWQFAETVMDNYEKYFVDVIRYRGDKSEISYPEFHRGLKALLADPSR
ncbi:LAMI_0A03796g1_1 [Lachancea mirantina]|uniref:LAMI_0A03796g1_1 n=1 Tax=Lachancea mirantina TaxID=1230905 RepID=A0A1G4INF3_9SACH|nr:LAMI_0A03796g1_1 [Lachancea mirantina]